mmetsp:Transcript_17360/g.44111  ORF Transcript_17360/g.44111 Transcript_17360/m.44111 type:complete len:462 (-) Transcript_17360:188-1573(-)
MQIITGIAGFKQLVRLAARCFYSGQVPPPDTTRNKRKGMDTRGLAVVALDALTRREWVEEDELAADLKINPHVLRKTLRVLEDEQFLRREHRKFKDKQKAEEAAAAGEERKPLYAKTQSLCCIDYPRVVEILQLRIHLMRKKLKDELEEADPIMTYRCGMCRKTYTSFDAVRLLSFTDHKLHCEDCESEVEQELGADGETGDDDQRRARKQMRKKLQAKMEMQLKPLLSQLNEVKGVDPPDYGFHQDWTREQALKVIKRQNAANGSGAAKNGAGANGAQLDPHWFDKMAVEVDLVSQEDAAADVKKEEAPAGKEMPAWMVTEADRQKAAEAAANAPKEPAEQDKRNAADVDDVHQEFVRQYMAAVAKRQQEVSSLRSAGQPDSKRLKTEAGPSAPASVPAVKPEPTGGAVKEEAIQWEEAQALQEDDDVQWEDAAPAPKTEAEAAGAGGADDDDFEWEDAS